MIVSYEGGARTGVLWQWHPNGALRFKGGVQGEGVVGLQQAWWPNGRRMQIGNAKNGLREGAWGAWDEQGALVPDVAGLYAAGQRVGDLDEAASAQAAAWAEDTSPQDATAAGLALADPLELYDAQGEPIGD